MLINRDPDGLPIFTPAMAKRMEELHFHSVAVVCDEPGAKVGDEVGISFIALTPFLPRVGDRLTLEDGRLCEVKRVNFKVVQSLDSAGAGDAILLMPNVYAVGL